MANNTVYPTFQFANRIDQENYSALINRASGEKLTVSQEGKLVSLRFPERCRYQFDSGYRKAVQDNVAGCIGALLPRLQSQNFTLDEGKSLVRRLGGLSPAVFHRQELRNAGPQGAFYTRLRDLAKQEVKKNTVPVHDGNAGDDNFWNDVSEAQIAEWAGIHFVRNEGGTSGNYRMKNLEGKTVALFKPVEESPHGEENPYLSIRIRNAFQNCLRMRDQCSVPEEMGHVREAFASRVCEKLNWNVNGISLVPTARVGTLESEALYKNGEKREGSIQRWIDGCEDGHSRVLKSNISNHKVPILVVTAVLVSLVALAAIAAAIVFLPAISAFLAPVVIHVAISALPIIASIGFLALLTDIGLVIAWIREKCIQASAADPNLYGFKQAALLAYLLCNLDFNPGNMLFKKGGNDLHAIDFWFSMPIIHPETWLDIRNMHLWGRLQIASTGITQQDVQPIQDTMQQIRTLIDTTFGPNSNERVHFDYRWQVIQAIIPQNRCYNDLARIITPDQMRSVGVPIAV